MTLLTICQSLAVNVGLPMPDVIATSPDRNWSEALRMANEAGEELARRVDWGVLTRSTTFSGDGVTQTFAMPADFARLGMGVTMRAGRQIVRPLTQAEWAGVSATTGVPRYFKLDDDQVRLWPIPNVGTTVAASYVSREWVAGASGYASDTDTAVFSEDLLTKGLIARWRRQKGMSFADEEAEYEAMLSDVAKFDDRSRF